MNMASRNIKAPEALSKSNSLEVWLKGQIYTDLAAEKQGPATFPSLEESKITPL